MTIGQKQARAVSTQPHEFHVPYQRSLRAIGKYLDVEQRSNVRIVEVDAGFHVRSNPAGASDPDTVQERLFRHDELHADELGSHARKSSLFKRGDRPRSAYQDIFRALGRELEEANAFFILLDELDDGYIVTYQHYAAESGFMLHKRRQVVSAKDASDLTRTAAQRREGR